MASGRYDNSPRWHCDGTDCAGPERGFAPPLPELAGQTCTAIVGLDGPICGRPAVRLDDRDPPRPICDRRSLKDLGGHIRGSPKHPDAVPAAAAAPGPSSAAATPPPLAPAAQDPPEGEPAWSAAAPDPDRPFTVGDARAFVQDAVSLVVNSVERVFEKHCGAGGDAAMAQDPGVAVHAGGLCGDGACAPCRSQRSAEHLQAKQIFADELDHAIEWRGRGKAGELLARDGSDALGDILVGWRAAGRPGPDAEPPGSSEQIEVVR